MKELKAAIDAARVLLQELEPLVGAHARAEADREQSEERVTSARAALARARADSLVRGNGDVRDAETLREALASAEQDLTITGDVVADLKGRSIDAARRLTNAQTEVDRAIADHAAKCSDSLLGEARRVLEPLCARASQLATATFEAQLKLSPLIQVGSQLGVGDPGGEVGTDEERMLVKAAGVLADLGRMLNANTEHCRPAHSGTPQAARGER